MGWKGIRKAISIFALRNSTEAAQLFSCSRLGRSRSSQLLARFRFRRFLKGAKSMRRGPGQLKFGHFHLRIRSRKAEEMRLCKNVFTNSAG